MTDGNSKLLFKRCGDHAGFKEAIDHIKATQAERNQTVNRIWLAIEAKVSVRVFLTILSVAVSILGLIIGAVFLNQNHVLNAMAASQEKLLCEIGDMKVDMGIIKHQFRIRQIGREDDKTE